MSQSIIVLQTPDSESLTELYVNAKQAHLTVEAFREPDLGDEITALAFLPCAQNVRFLASLPLAGKRLPEDSVKSYESMLKRISLQIQDSEAFKRGRLLRECYFAFVDHLHGHVNLHGYNSWDLPEYSDEERQHLLAQQPHPWVMDRALTFFFADGKDRQPYAHDERITSLFHQPESVSGFDLVMSNFARKVSL